MGRSQIMPRRADGSSALIALLGKPLRLHQTGSTPVCQTAIDRAARNPRRPRYRNNAAMSGRTRLTGREQPSPSLVQNWLKCLEASPDGIDVNHDVRIGAPAVEARQFPDSFVAFLSVSRFFPADSLVLAQALSREHQCSAPRAQLSSSLASLWRQIANFQRACAFFIVDQFRNGFMRRCSAWVIRRIVS
jgi:hypothetical protein